MGALDHDRPAGAWKQKDPMQSLDECFQTLVRCVGGEGNLLFNVGPMPDDRRARAPGKVAGGRPLRRDPARERRDSSHFAISPRRVTAFESQAKAWPHGRPTLRLSSNAATEGLRLRWASRSAPSQGNAERFAASRGLAWINGHSRRLAITPLRTFA